jgi:hypothetical protein
VLAPAIKVSKPTGIGGLGMQWAAVRTSVGVRRVPPQINWPPFNNIICHGLEWAGASMPPPTIQSNSKKYVSLLITNTWTLSYFYINFEALINFNFFIKIFI